MVGKELLINAAISPFERKCVYDEIKNIIEKNDHLYYFTETFILFNKEITFIYDNENDQYFEECDSALDYVTIYDVKVYDIEKLLNEHNIEFQKSTISESIYFKHNEKEYRLSAHKRPAYEHNGVWYDHDYENEIICKDEKEMYITIKNILEVK